MRLMCILVLLWAGPVAMAQEKPVPAEAPGVRLQLELSDGSRVIGVPDIHELKITTDYADMAIPLPLLRTIELSGSNNIGKANFKNGDALSGRLAATEITVKTIFGQVVIPMNEVRTIQVSGGTGMALPDGLVLHYTFDKDDGDRVIDASGNGNDGKVHGATYTSEGKAGGAMSFNGDREVVDAGNPAGLQLQDFTIMAWIKRGSASRVTASGEDAAVFGYGHGGYILGMHPNGRVFLSKVDVDDVGPDCEIPSDGFHHLAVTKEGNHIIFYLDGVAFPAPAYNPGFEFSTDAAVGCRADNLGNCFDGVIDEVAVFNRALTSDEVKAIYDAQK